MPTAWRLTEYLPQKSHRYLECWLTSIFLICLRRDAPYLVPYFPTIPTFFVRFAYTYARGSAFPPACQHAARRFRTRPRTLRSSFSKTLVVGGWSFPFHLAAVLGPFPLFFFYRSSFAFVNPRASPRRRVSHHRCWRRLSHALVRRRACA